MALDFIMLFLAITALLLATAVVLGGGDGPKPS
jgi:hypothetical protein